ncbi:WD repeat-containing protein 43 [Pectinophora gossypiella]|nr:WD repeat-containing protein 43 [Pectinophora gossypiella]
MAETAFSEDGKYFSAISQDGRLRIWDTETNVLKQEYTPDLHLTSPPSCLQWISVAQSVTPQKDGRRKSVSGDQEIQCIALGTTSGKILIYSVAQAKVETVLEEKNNEINRNCITALDWSKKYGLYSCNKESLVYEWNLQSTTVRNKYNVNIENKNKQVCSVSAIKIIPHNQNSPARFLVTASTQIRIWRLHGEDADLVKCLGHNAAPKALLALAGLNNSCWLVEGSQNERLLSFWDVTITGELLPQVNGGDTTPNRKKRKKSTSAPITIPTPVYNFVLEDAPKQLDVAVSSEENGTRLCLAAVTRSGVVHYYGHMLNGASSKPIKPSVSLQVTSPGARPRPLRAARLLPAALLLAYDHDTRRVFERLTPDLSTKTQVLIRGEEKESKKKQNKQSQKEKQDAGDVTYVEPMGGVSRKRTTPGATVEVPMEQRLANLTVDLSTRGRAPVSHNLTKLLVQGLHSNDKKLILSVLQTNKASVAQQTVSALPAALLPRLLLQLADMAARRTSQCAAVCTWLSALLRCHAALLLAAMHANTGTQLTHLLAIFTNRRSHLCQLLNLKGRLELTMAQRAPADQQLQQDPVLEYNDSSSEEEMEVERAASESDNEQSWGEGSDASSVDE